MLSYNDGSFISTLTPVPTTTTSEGAAGRFLPPIRARSSLALGAGASSCLARVVDTAVGIASQTDGVPSVTDFVGASPSRYANLLKTHNASGHRGASKIKGALITLHVLKQVSDAVIAHGVSVSARLLAKSTERYAHLLTEADLVAGLLATLRATAAVEPPEADARRVDQIVSVVAEGAGRRPGSACAVVTPAGAGGDPSLEVALRARVPSAVVVRASGLDWDRHQVVVGVGPPAAFLEPPADRVRIDIYRLDADCQLLQSDTATSGVGGTPEGPAAKVPRVDPPSAGPCPAAATGRVFGGKYTVALVVDDSIGARRRRLARALAGAGIDLRVERSLTWPQSFVLDERTVVCLVSAAEDDAMAVLDGLLAAAMCAHVIYVVIEAFGTDSTTSDDAPTLSEPVLAFFSRLHVLAEQTVPALVRIWTSFSTQTSAALVVRACEEAAAAADVWSQRADVWASRDWLMTEESEAERFLASLAGLNHFAAQIVLTWLSLGEFLSLPLADKKATLVWIPADILDATQATLEMIDGDGFGDGAGGEPGGEGRKDGGGGGEGERGEGEASRGGRDGGSRGNGGGGGGGGGSVGGGEGAHDAVRTGHRHASAATHIVEPPGNTGGRGIMFFFFFFVDENHTPPSTSIHHHQRSGAPGNGSAAVAKRERQRTRRESVSQTHRQPPSTVRGM